MALSLLAKPVPNTIVAASEFFGFSLQTSLSCKDTIQRYLVAEMEPPGELASQWNKTKRLTSVGEEDEQQTAPNEHDEYHEASEAADESGLMFPGVEGRGKRSADQGNLERAMKRFGASIKPINVFDFPSDDDVLSLNVGGTHLDVCRGTLTCMPSLLATKYSGEWDDSLIRDASGRFFVDEEPELFVSVVNYLRDVNRMLPSANGLTYAKPPSFSDSDKQLRWERLLESIHLEPIRPFKWMRLCDFIDLSV